MVTTLILLWVYSGIMAFAIMSSVSNSKIPAWEAVLLFCAYCIAGPWVLVKALWLIKEWK